MEKVVHLEQGLEILQPSHLPHLIPASYPWMQLTSHLILLSVHASPCWSHSWKIVNQNKPSLLCHFVPVVWSQHQEKKNKAEVKSVFLGPCSVLQDQEGLTSRKKTFDQSGEDLGASHRKGQRQWQEL